MAHRGDSPKGISMKNKLIMVAIMFVLINLIFYFGFDSSDESGENKELDFGEKLNEAKMIAGRKACFTISK